MGIQQLGSWSRGIGGAERGDLVAYPLQEGEDQCGWVEKGGSEVRRGCRGLLGGRRICRNRRKRAWRSRTCGRGSGPFRSVALGRTDLSSFRRKSSSISKFPLCEKECQHEYVLRSEQQTHEYVEPCLLSIASAASAMIDGSLAFSLPSSLIMSRIASVEMYVKGHSAFTPTFPLSSPTQRVSEVLVRKERRTNRPVRGWQETCRLWRWRKRLRGRRLRG